MDRFKGLELINRIDKLIENNNSVISAIEQDKKINILKAIKASMKSNNEIAYIVKNIIGTNNTAKNNYENSANDFFKFFENK